MPFVPGGSFVNSRSAGIPSVKGVGGSTTPFAPTKPVMKNDVTKVMKQIPSGVHNIAKYHSATDSGQNTMLKYGPGGGFGKPAVPVK